MTKMNFIYRNDKILAFLCLLMVLKVLPKVTNVFGLVFTSNVLEKGMNQTILLVSLSHPTF